MQGATGSPRWWPLVAIILSMAVGVLALHQLYAEDRQQAGMSSLLVVVAGLVLILLWLLAFSRLPARWRIGAAAGYLGVLGLLFAAFRIEGVTGDLRPILSWRFASAPRVAPLPQGEAAPPTLPVEGLADFPQFFGPGRDGRLAGPRLVRSFATAPPELLWRRQVGAGWSGFAVAGRRAITQEQHGEEETVVCRDVVTGEVSWVHRDTARFASTVAGTGPRATPTIDGDVVFSLGSTGVLNCLELATGHRLWRRDILRDAGAALPEWGVAGSPLVLGPVVVVNSGGPGYSLVGYDRNTGAVTWHGGDDQAHWSSPVHATLAGREQILMFGAAVSGHDARDGAVLWSHPWRGGHPHVAMPMPCGADRVLVSSGYGTGAELLQVTGADGSFAVRRLWKRPTLKAKFANFIPSGGVVYGLDDGTLTCVDLATGRKKWKGGRYGHGQLLLVGELLLVASEEGELVLLEAVPDGHRELARHRVFAAKTWNPPALAGRFLLWRNDKEAACLRLGVVE